jgi:LysM repeat protein
MAMEASEFSFLFEPSLDADVLRVILSRLPCLPLLARAACVSRSWRTVATDPALLMNCFKAQWKLRDVVGRPSLSSSPKFFHSGLRLFAISHPLQRWDTVDSLAVKYDVQATEIRNFNHMSSDYDIHRRKRLLIPVTKPEFLAGKTCYIEYDPHTKCELAVLYARGELSGSEDARSSEMRIVQSSSGESRVSEIDRASTSGNAIPDVDLDRVYLIRGLNEARPSAEEKGKYVEDIEDIAGLTEDLWRKILGPLPVTALGQAACVCRLWHSIATDPAALASAFMAPWKLKKIVGRPMSRSFWRGQLAQLAISHRLQRQDTMAGLAVKYRVQVPEIRRVNNMMSDHGIHSRERLLIPVSDPEVLVGQTCFIEVDAFAKREVGVVYLDWTGPNLNEATRAAERAQHKLKKEVLESLKRSLKVDDSTAKYYFSLDDGDLRGALQEFTEDLQWERSAQ